MLQILMIFLLQVDVGYFLSLIPSLGMTAKSFLYLLAEFEALKHCPGTLAGHLNNCRTGEESGCVELRLRRGSPLACRIRSFVRYTLLLLIDRCPEWFMYSDIGADK